MPKKINVNILSVTEAPNDCDVLNLFTNSKKAHFNVPMPKLYDSITTNIRDNMGYFQVRLSVYPYIAVHIYGHEHILAREKEALTKSVEAALASHFDSGMNKIKPCCI